jgi:ABC-type phosphate transport system substrate-binding protein
MGWKTNRTRRVLQAVACAALLTAIPATGAVKNLAVVTAAGSKLTDVSLGDLSKFCKGAAKTWPDGKNFSIVIKNPNLPEMRAAVSKLFGTTPAEIKAAIEKLNETRQAVKIVESDEQLLRTVEETPGAVGLVDVYSINSAVKVLRVDGKLPFDPGYVFKGN